ncbi:MAG: cyclic nucleotide-binding domain-containing protein [Gammaproteobacteria bacterium]
MEDKDTVGTDIKKAFIKKQPVFAKLNDEEVNTLVDLLVEKHYQPDETIVTEGEPVDSVLLIVKGDVDVRHVSIQDHQPVIQSLATLSAGTAIGLNETGFYSLSGVRTATVVAKTEVITLYLSMARFHGFALAYPHVSEIMRKNADAHVGTKF